MNRVDLRRQIRHAGVSLWARGHERSVQSLSLFNVRSVNFTCSWWVVKGLVLDTV